MRLLVERRHRDVAKSDFRDGGGTGTEGGRTSVTIRPKVPHLGTFVDEDAGNVDAPVSRGPFRAE